MHVLVVPLFFVVRAGEVIDELLLCRAGQLIYKRLSPTKWLAFDPYVNLQTEKTADEV